MISVQTEDFNIQREYDHLRATAGNAGAIVTFSGLVREFYRDSSGGQAEDQRIEKLYLEHYPGMTEKCLREICEQAQARWSILASRVIHRVGELSGGDQIVFVGVASAHRSDAFEAAQFLMDYLKSRAPFWKKESTAQGENWVESKESDEAALSRW